MSESATELARQSELDGAVTGREVDATDAEQVFGVVDLLNGSSALRRAFSDPTASNEAKQQLVERLLGGKLGAIALAVVERAVSLRWGTAGQLVAALERQGARLQFDAAQRAGTLDRVIDELFRVSRAAVDHPELGALLNNRSASAEGRRAVLGRLLTHKADPATVQLAERAVTAGDGTFQNTLERYLDIAAALRDRFVAHVTVARPLDAEQASRMKAALVKMAGHDVDMQVYVDPSVIGGARVELGDEVVEGTVSHRLEQLRRSFN